MWHKIETNSSNISGMAYYRHSAENSHKNTVAIQQEHVRKYAAENGIDIIREFTDSDRFKLLFEGGEDFKKIVEMMVELLGEFDCALLLDASKWGQCRDIDSDGDHQRLFKEFGKIIMFRISYCDCKD